MSITTRMLDYAIDSFHFDRFIMLRKLPEDVTTSDIKSLFAKFNVNCKELAINPSLQTAKVILSSSREYEIVSKHLNAKPNLKIRNVPITVSFSNNEHLLCVSNLPREFNNDDFREQVQLFGETKFCFLMYHESLGEVCNYGFVKYLNCEVAIQARNLLFRKEINGHKIYCDWVDSHLTSYDKLYSLSIQIDCLPPNYYNIMELRERFSKFAIPSYCQIAMKNGQPIGMGIVEYKSIEDCTKSYSLLKENVIINDAKARLSFCVPGIRAINIVDKILGSIQMQGGLLPEPPPAAAYLSKLQLMALQRPEVSSNLLGMVTNEVRNIMAQKTHAPVSAAATSSQTIAPSDSVFKRPITSIPRIVPSTIPIDINHNLHKIPLTMPVYANPTMMSPIDLLHQQMPVINPLALPINGTAALYNEQLNAINHGAYLQHPIRRPLVEKTSPNENRYSPYARPHKAVWDYSNSPVSSKSTQSKYLRDRNKVKDQTVPHILPSPECSPETLYVGQHSQGIGGHYADSYLRKKLSKLP